MKWSMVTFDYGNPPCRVILGVYDGEQITAEIISQIPNYMVRVRQYFHWNILTIYQKLLEGLKEAVKWVGTIRLIGTCTWDVDFIPFGNRGSTIQDPSSCRNSIGVEILEQMSGKQRTYLSRQAGILCDKINSVNMTKGMMERMQFMFSHGHKLPMIPDILNYLFTGCMVNEPSELPTIRLMDARRKELSEEALKTMEIPFGLFASIGRYGTVIGTFHSNVEEVLDISYGVPVICVSSHDTAAMVLAIPIKEEESLFVNTGTWAPIGMELKEPIVDEEMRKRCLTNEVEAFGNIILLWNSAGIFIIQHIKEEYEEEHETIGWGESNSLGDCHEEVAPLSPVSDSRFFSSVHMSDEIWNCLVKADQASGEEDRGTIMCSFQDSMALSLASVIQGLEGISGEKRDVVYMIDDGSQNVRLYQMTTNAIGKKVVTGGKESMSLGNLGAQLKYFRPEMTVGKIKHLLRTDIESAAYYCGKDSGGILKRYQKPEG